MLQFHEIIANFERTLRLADLSSTELAVAVILSEEAGPKLYQYLPWHQSRFAEWIQQIHLTGEHNLAVSDESLERSFSGPHIEEEIVIVQSGKVEGGTIRVFLFLPVEQVEFKLFATAICMLLAEAVTNYWILSNNFSPDNLCRTASRLLMEQVMGIEPIISQSLFILLDRIALLPYEDRKSYGSIVFSRASSIAVEEVIHLKKLVTFSNIRGIRKLLEIGKDKFCLLASEDGVYGFGLSLDSSQDVVQVDFRLDSSWVLTRKGHKIYRVRAGLPMVFRPKLETRIFYQQLNVTFPGMTADDMQNLLTLLMAAANQSNGTNILIIEDALQIAQRLESQCTLIDPIRLTSDMMAHISRIDGTVLIKPDGVCVGFGAILDGRAARNGDSARGGRYNSAVMFCENSDTPCLIVVVSQDGTVDLVSSMNYLK